jgi:guanylate kinase
MSSDAPGQLFIVSAPSGTGKTTLVEQLVQVVPDLALSRSFTSRPPRPGECDGVDYNFISRALFDRMIRDGEFLEFADVFGNFYGTSASQTDRILAAGHDLVLVIDVQGARQVRARRADTIGIFVLPPTFAVLEERLRGRSKDSDAQIRRRLDVARQEVDAVADYDYVVVNDELERAVGRLRAIVEAERARLRRMEPTAARIIETFR